MQIIVPSVYMGGIDALLTVEPNHYDDSYAMTLRVGGRIIALGTDLRPGALYDFDDPADARLTVETFGGFLAHAIESSEEDARDGWSVLDTDAAAEWTDALALFGADEESNL